MSTKSTKNNKQLTYPCIVNICKAMGSKRKSEVIRAIDRVTGEDLSKAIVYPTLRNAYYAGVDLVKESIDSKWVRIEKTDAEARQIIEETGLCTGIAAAAAPAPVTKPAKVHKPAKAATPALGAPAKSKKATKPAKAIAATPAAVAKASKATKASSEDFEPTEADIQEIQHMLAMGLEDSDSLIDGFDSI